MLCSKITTLNLLAIANRIHKAGGCILVIIAWVTIVFGIKEWEFLGRGTPISVSILIGITCSLSAILYAALIVREKYGDEYKNKILKVG
jgi:hypothetical protein